MQELKVQFWQFFRQGRDGCALLVQPLRIPRWISKTLFVLGSYKFLAMLKSKTGGCHFFKVQSGKKTVCSLLACGEGRKLTAEQIAAPKTESTDAGEIGLCSYTIISDRFALTAEHCIIG